MMKRGLYTGAHLLHDGASERVFGMVGGFGPSDEQGTVRLTLDSRCIPCESDGESLTINMPERCARELASALLMTAIQLEHLRSLLRLGRLTSEALLHLSEEGGEVKP
jgi:hypothetical protein